MTICPPSLRLAFAFAGMLSIAPFAHAIAQAPQTDVLRGRVLAADSTPLQNATITAIDTVAKVPKQIRTDAKGAYAITFDNGNGTYIVAVTVLGYGPQRRTVARRSDGTLPAIDFRMTPVAAQLGAVKSVGERPKTVRSDINGDGSTGGTTSYQSLSTGLTGDMTGDLTSVLSTLPGIAVTTSATGGTPTVSAFGIGSDQNGLVLNGMGFGAQVPRDGFRLAVVSSSYDPGRGGFAGVQLSLRMESGNNTTTRSTHATFDTPALQWTSPVADRLGNRYGQQVVSGVVSGPIAIDKAFYSTSYQFSRRASSLTSLSSADPASLIALRVNPDSVSRLLGLLGPIGIPERTAQVPSGRQNVEGRFAARLDFEPNIPPTPPGAFNLNNATFDDYYLEFGATLRNSDGAMIGPTSIPSSGGGLSHHDGWIQLTSAKYLPRNILNETTISLNGGQDRSDPYLALPSARVLVASGLADGGVGISALQVGGSNSPRSNSTTWATELRNQATWNTWDRRHSFALTLDGTFDGYAIRQDAGFGSFFFNSLADFGNGAPASYSRTLTAPHTSGSGFAGAIGLGETYTPTPPGSTAPGVTPPSRPTIQYGVRLEGNHYGFQPTYNPAVDSLFGVHTDHVPGGVRVMPMLGFNWPIFKEFRLDNGIKLGRRGSLSGGVREYRGTLSTRAIDAYTRQTGLPSAIQQLYCVGSATPLPDWRAYEQGESFVPTACADGNASTPLAQTTPPVSLFAPDYRTYDSWRPTMTFSYTINATLRASLNGTYAINRNVPAIYDLNFNPASKFSLVTEGGRPVFISPMSVVPATGAEAWTESRESSRFAHVTESRSDLRSETRTFGASLTYTPFVLNGTSGFTFGSVSYALNDAREQFRGFGGTTDGDPRSVGWSSGAIAKHVFTAALTRFEPKWGTVGIQARVQSGAPFTPIIAGDVNGDGYSNDRAFVFRPGVAPDSMVANAMSQLLQSAPSNARRCLQRQLGTIAGRNSCSGPWSMPMFNLSISPESYRLGFRNRGSVKLLVTNVLSGLDQALHGSSKLHGWGQFAYADPTLLTVRGFDPTSNQFKYTVNPLFGSSTQFRNAFRTPFMLTLDVRLEVGPDRETQFLSALLRPRASEGAALTEQQIKARIARGVNPIDQVLLVKDSLKFTQSQLDSLAAISKHYAASRDSIVTEMARYLIARHGSYDGEDVRRRWHTAGLASYRAYLTEARMVIAMLTPEQRERAKNAGPLAGFLTIEGIKDSDLPFIFRYPLPSLP